MPRHVRLTTVFPVALREVEVSRIVDVTPGVRRITRIGEQLGAFTSGNGFVQAGFSSSAFDDDIRLQFPHPRQTEPVLPAQAEGRLERSKDPRVLYRVYSAGRWHAVAGELDVDFVKHGIGVAEHTHRQELRALTGVEVTWLVRDGVYAGTTSPLTDAVRAASSEAESEPEYREKLWEQTAGYAEYLAPALTASRALSGVSHLVIVSNGPGPEAHEAAAAHCHVTISAPPEQAKWLRSDLTATTPDTAQRERVTVVEQNAHEPAPAADLVLLVRALGSFPDTDVSVALRAAAAGPSTDGQVLLIEHISGAENLLEHEAEADLHALTRDGTGLRTEAELDTIIEADCLRLRSVARSGGASPSASSPSHSHPRIPRKAAQQAIHPMDHHEERRHRHGNPHRKTGVGTPRRPTRHRSRPHRVQRQQP